MPRKPIIKVILSKEQHQILKNLARKLGTSESEIMRTAFMEYAKELNMVTEHIHEKPQP
jgi:predicted DNA-binding protein